MSDSPSLGFGKFVPGFDFLQNLAKGATQNIPQMPNLGNWVAPTPEISTRNWASVPRCRRWKCRR